MPYPHSFDSAAGPIANGRAQAPTTPPMKHEMGSSSQKPISASLSSSPLSSSSSSGSSPSTPAARRTRQQLHVGVFSKRKGVHYNSEGRVLNCRFCEILRVRDEQFLYEDDSLVVFRPLHPIVPSHILIVPRAHIRNVNQLTVNHVELLRRMRSVAEQVLHAQPACADHSTSSSEEAQVRNKTKHNQDSPKDVSVDEFPGHTVTDMDDEIRNHHYPSHKPVAEDTECRFAFHVPPFNSIDHVHMHAFRGSTGYFGRIKYRTESWWCRSYDDVLARLELALEQAEATATSTTAAAVTANGGLPAPVQGQPGLHRRYR